MAAKAARKKSSGQTLVSETVIPRDDEADEEHKRVVFTNNHTQKPVLVLYRKTEKAAPISHLWKDFIQESQLVRDQIGLDILDSFLTDEEQHAVELKNNAQIFPELVTSKGFLVSKDNAKAAALAPRVRGVFTKSSAAATTTKGDEFRARAKALKVKALAYTKQSEAYKAAASLVEGNSQVDESLISNGMNFLENELPLSQKELNRHL